jgi:putative ABC transport system permease protein
MSEGQQLRLMAFDDVNERIASPIIRGRQPIANNEISLLSPTANWLGVGIGDSIEVQHLNGEKATFLITGITQGWGANGFITTEGVRRMQDDFVLRNIYIYLYDYSDQAVAAFMNQLVEDFGRDMTAMNYVEQNESFFRTMEQPINIAMIFIMVITIFVIVLVLFLMVNTIINRHKQEAGMLKAIGFTSGQLMIQMLLSFLPIILGGVIFGSVLGLLLTNPLLGVMFSGLGVAQASFTIVPALAALGGGMITATAVATISLVSLKYKKATAHSLIAKN